MKSKLLFTSILVLFIGSARAQEYEKPKSQGGDTTGTKNTLQQTGPSGIVKPSEVIEKGTINPVKHNPDKDSDLTKKEQRKRHKCFLKKLKRKRKSNAQDSILKNEESSIGKSIQQVAPTILSSWNGGQMNGSSPPDHTMAISNNGNIIVADNERIYFYTTSGSLQGAYTYNSFFSVNTGFTDPHVLYDSGADKFIFVIQSGPNAVEEIIVCYSSSNNPFVDGFSVYTYDIVQLTGDDIDYPNIAVSTDELYVTGNLGSSDNILLAFNKTQGYAGNTVDAVYWTGIQDGGGWNARALFPLQWGQQGNYGPGIYFISTEKAIINNNIYLWEVTDNQYNSPSVVLLSSISVPTFTLPSAAVQLGTGCGLDGAPWDNITGGFYLNGIIHCCYMADDGNGYSKGLYNRITVSNYNITTKTVALTNSDYRFLSVASIGNNQNDKSAVVGFLRSDNSVYPQMRFKYYDNVMNTVSSSLVKAGEDYVCYTGNPDRWGDYTYIQRRFNTTTYPVVWFAGGYGNTSNKWSTWVAEIGYSTTTQAPVASFTASNTNICTSDCINFTDNSTNSPTSWNWSFPGAAPSSSTAQNPTNICYNTSGTYNVSLMATNSGGSNTKTNNNYITVNTCTGISESANNSLVDIIPNPNNGNFSIVQNGNIKNLHIFVTNELGQQIFEAKVSVSKYEIDLSNQPNGIYFIQISSEKESFIKKIILNK